MPFDKALWKNDYNEDAFPNFPCPRCSKGWLILNKENLQVKEPYYSSKEREHEAWELEWIVERFVAFSICNNNSCREIVTIAGEANYIEIYDEYEQDCIRQLRIKNFFPAPPIIDLPENTAREVKNEIKVAFQLFWCDLGASANRLRCSIEHLLDDQGIPKASTLHARILKFKETSPDHASILSALKFVGNLGSHGHAVSRSVLLDAFQILEYTLAELYEKRSETIKEISQKIIDSKGKY